MLLLQWGWGSLGFCSISSENFFLIEYGCLSLVLSIDFYYSQLIFFRILFKKKTQKWISKKTMKYSTKNEFIKERWGTPTFKLRKWSWAPTFPLLGRGASPTFKLWGRSRGPGSRSTGPTFTLCLQEDLTSVLTF